MAYSKTQWNTGDPITQERMNHIEDGIALAQSTAEAASSTANGAVSVNNTQNDTIGEMQTAITNLNTNIGNVNAKFGTDFSSENTVTQTIANLRTALEQGTGDGTRAWSQLLGAGVSYNSANNTYVKTLAQVFAQYPLTQDVITPAIQTPSTTDTVMIDNTSQPVNTLARRIRHIYNAISDTNDAIDHVHGENDLLPNGLKQRMSAAETDIGTIYDLVHGTSNQSVAARLDHLDGGNINSSADFPSRTIKSLITELDDAHSSTAYASGGAARTYTGIDDRFETIETEIAGAHITNGTTLDARFDNIDGGSVPTRTLPSIIGEINDAHRTDLGNDEVTGEPIVDTLDKRFDDIDTRIGAIDNSQNSNSLISRISTLENTYVNKNTMVENGLTYEQSGKVLDARQGKILDDKITALDTAIDTRLDAIEAARPSTTDPVSGETTYGTLDDRFDAIEDDTAQLRTDINTIANELAMVDTDTIVSNNTRVDQLETDLRTMAAELDMLDGTAIVDTNTRIDGITTEINAAHRTLSEGTDTLDNRFDDIESDIGDINDDITDLSNAIDHVHGENDELPNGLTQRITALETTVDTAETGLSDRMTSAETRLSNIDNNSTGALKGLDDRLDAIDGGNIISTANGTLSARVTALEGKDTIVVDYDGEHSNYTDNVPNMSTSEIKSNADYLIADDEGKYFYWRYINNNWEMISGAGGEGGNSSGYVLTTEEYSQLANKALNTDYYVIDENNIHHYRWIPSETPSENTQIEITQIINTDNIKRYLVAKHDRNNNSGEPSSYLDFYEFAYGVNPEIDDENHALNRIAEIELPKGGGGTVSSDTVCSVSYVSSQNQLLTQEVFENEGAKISFFYLAYTKQVEDNETLYLSQPCTYTLKKGTRVIDSGNLKARDVVIDSQGNPVILTDEYKRLNATTLDITKYCKVNEDNDFTLTVTTTGVTPRVRPFHVEVVELGLKSTFNDQTVFNANTALRIPLTISSPERTKTIYVELDEDTENAYEITQVHGEKASSTTTITIPADKLTPGVHSVRIYFEEVISGESPASSNDLLFDLACRDVNNDTAILLASPYRGKVKELDQYKTFKIPYYLYIPDGMSTNIVKTNGATGKTTIEAGHTGDGEFLFKASQSSSIENDEMVPFTLTIGCQVENSQILDPSFTVQVKVIANEYNIEPVLDNLVFDFNPTGYINNPQNEEDKYWRDENNPSIRLSEVEGANFDWDNGGWKYDDEMEAPYFCVKAGSRAQINYSLFQDNMETAGSEFKCIFKAVNVRDPEAIFLTSLDKQTSTVISYSPEKMSSDQNADGYKLDANEDDKATLFSSYLNVKEGRVLIYKKGSLDETKIALSIVDGTTIQYSLDDEENTEWLSDPENELDTSYIMTNARFEAALNAAKNKVIKKNTTDYAKKIIGYVKAYDGPEASDLRTLMVGPQDNETSILLGSSVVNNKTVYNADTIFTTLQESNDWASFRETTTYNDQIVIDLETLVKNLKNLTYATEIITTNNFVKMVIEDDHDDEYEQKLVKNIRAQKANGDIVETQIEINYELDDHDNKIYNDIYLVRQILDVDERSRGLEMRAHRANIHLGSGTLTYPYSEEDIIEFEYNISNPIARKKTAPILMYEDGVPSASMLYSTNSNALVQADKGNLIIGSDDCDIQIYRMKFYNKKLNNIEILSNFYADALNPEDMVERYETNVATYTDSADPDSITPQSIAASCPDLRVIMIEAPTLTGGKNSFIKNSKIRCIYKGEDARPEDNWVALNAYHAGQGTSSDAYGAAGRNLDIIFGFDGIDPLIAPKAKNNYRFDPNYKSILITGVDDTDNAIGTADSYIDEILGNLNEGKIETDEDYVTREALLEENDFTDTHLHMYLNGTGKVNFNDESVPNNWFNIKLNIASSENANNALLQKRYDRYLKEIYQTPAQKRDPRIKNDMEFFNCVVFIKETSEDRNEFDDGNWHFYGIGNIGDSKKTDNTRVNIPNDPFEFCVEVSDNGLTNSGFSSGVYWTDATKTTTTYNPAGSYEIKYPVTMEEWTNENNTTYAALTDYEEDGGWDSSLEFRYDVSTKDGNTIADSDAEEELATARQEHNKEVFKNMYQWVVTAPLTGDNAFANHLRDWFIEDSPLYWYVFTERYTMIDSRAKNTFYHFGKVYVSAEEIDGETAAECTRVQARQAALTAALSGNDPIAIAIAQTAYDTAVYVWKHKDCFILEGDTAGSYAGAAQINDGYRFDLWDYDNDTALGINNNGQMVFDAGLEDIDRTANAWVYNEATNVFWRRIRNEMQSKLRAIYTSRKADCFNAENLIKEFDKWQAQFPENLWRMDFERKYYRPYIEGNNMRYLRDMANGRKKYQRRQFERNMCIYINSKYILTDAYDPNDFIQFRPTTQQDANQDKMVKITCYSPMYINFSIGNQANTPGSHVRCSVAGETKSFNFFAGITDAQNIQTKIFNASRIKEITGLENYYADDLDFTAASKLRKITLGSNVAKIIDPNTGEESTIPYRNNNTKTLVLGAGNPILEILDIRNCTALAPELDLTECVSLGTLYATGTPLTKVNLAAGGLIKELYLPATMASLEFNNLYLLDTVQLAGYNNIISYISNNIFKYNSKTIVYNTLSHLTELKLNDINWTIGDIDELEQFKQKQLVLGNKMSISGHIKITGEYSDIELQDYDNFWNHKIIFDATTGTKQTRWKVTYKYDDYYNEDTEQTITGDTIKVLYVADGAQIPDIWEYWDEEKQEVVNILTTEDGWSEPPHRNSTRSTNYTFGTYTDNHYNEYSGWKYEDAVTPINTAITASNHITLYTYFKTTDRTYTINWYLKLQDNGDGTSYPVDLVKSSNNVKYGQGYDQSAPTVKDIHDAYSRSLIQNSTATINIEDNIATYEIFDGWQRLPTNINPDGSSNNFNIFAKWKTGQLALNNGVIDNVQNLSPEELAILSNLPLTAAAGPSRQKCAPTFVTSQTISYQMGHDYNTTISPIMNTQRGQNTSIWRFDRNDNPMTINSIAPFNAESTANGWTMAIDYSFAPDINYDNPSNNFYPNAAVLAGCYDVVEGENTNTIVGFALYENRNSDYGPVGPCIGFGDMFNQAGQVVSLGAASTIGERDIVVIRKPKNSSSLFIYTGKNGYSTIQTTIAAPEKSWNKITTEAKLELGKLSHSSLSALVTRAKGTIYWAKYWPEDLGVGECLELAAWPHETITFGVANNNSNATSRDRLNPQNTAITLTAISSSNYGVLTQSAAGKTYGDITGWSTSLARTICNTRIFQGLPTTLQSIICKASVGTKNLEIKKDGGGANINVLTNVEAVRDYIYLPSVANYSSVSEYLQEGGLYPWANSSAGVTVYTYTVSGSQFSQNSASSTYKNLRFPGQPISLATLRILNIEGQASNFKDIFNGENSPYGAIVSGDIVIENNQMAYMYVSSNDILTKGLQVEPDSGKFATDGNGGWLPAQEHWTRSMSYNNSTNYYIYVDNEIGALQNNSPSASGLHLNYSFSV